jgi:uncharacterized protein involved in exopolysaccharide biosynthesis
MPKSRASAPSSGALVGPRHPSITNLDAQIQGVQKLINEELSRIATAARSDLERTQASEKALEADLETLQAEAVTTSQASVRLRELERDVEAGRAIYQAFLARARETGEQQSIDNTNARVILRRRRRRATRAGRRACCCCASRWWAASASAPAPG